MQEQESEAVVEADLLQRNEPTVGDGWLIGLSVRRWKKAKERYFLQNP
jgi:hypothetical protein